MEVGPTGSLTLEQLRQAVMNPQFDTKTGFIKTTVGKVRQDKGFPVKSFRDLMHYVAELGSCNTHFNLFFRGQNADYTDKYDKTKLYPSIFRPPRERLSPAVLETRFKRLGALIETLRINQFNLELSSSLGVFDAYWLSILQHYGVCHTPFLDLTQSLRVAATFALLDTETHNLRESGYLYVFGMPHLHGSISFFADDRMTIVKLQNVCPPKALRPHFQEGYLVGRWPGTTFKEKGDNFAHRLVGKYWLDNIKTSFFDKEFPPMPQEALLPEPDPFMDQINDLAKRTPA
jgi:hypothetical protein